jgi:AcrR family transcriptional regulator
MDGQRRRFCEAAVRCFRRHGVVATNLAAICDEAGLSMGALYKLFSSRDDLLEAVLLMRLTDRNERLRGETWADLRQALLDYRADMEQSPFWREFEGVTDWNEQLRSLRVRQGKVIMEQIEHELRRYQAAGEIAPTMDLRQTTHMVSLIFDGSLAATRQARELHVSAPELGAYFDLAVGAMPRTERSRPRATRRRSTRTRA